MLLRSKTPCERCGATVYIALGDELSREVCECCNAALFAAFVRVEEAAAGREAAITLALTERVDRLLYGVVGVVIVLLLGLIALAAHGLLCGTPPPTWFAR